MAMFSSDVSSSFVHLLSHFLPFGSQACNVSEMRTAFSWSSCKALASLWSYPFFELPGAAVTQCVIIHSVYYVYIMCIIHSVLVNS